MKKTRKIRLLAFILTLCMTIGALPLYVFADKGEEIPEELQDRIVEEVPFEPEYLPGDLTFAECRTATLNMAEVPAVISQAQIEQYQHVNRLYEQEPDLYTVIFQNRDGSKTVYVFAQPVKSTSGNGVVTDMSAAAIVSAHQPALPSQNAMMQNALSQNVAPILAMQERLDAYKAANDLKDYQMLDDVLEVTTVNSSAALVLNNSVSVASVSTTYSPLSGEYAIKLPNDTKYLTCINNSIVARSYVSVPYAKWLFEYCGGSQYLIQSLSKQGYYLAYVDGDSCGLEQWEDNDEGNEEIVWSVIPNFNETGYTISLGGYALADNASMVSEGNEPVCQLTNHTTFVPLTSVSISQTVITASVDEYVYVPTIYTNPENASYAISDSDFAWYTTNDSMLTPDMDSFFVLETGIAQIYCKHLYTGIESNRVTVIVSETPPAGEAITSGAVYLIRPYAETIDASTKLLTMNVASSGNTLSLASWGTQYGSEENVYYKWGSLSQGFTITQIGTENLYRISAILSTDQYNGGWNFVNKYTIPNTLYAASSNSLGLKRADSGRTDKTPNNDDLTQLWKMYYADGGWAFVNAAYPQAVLKYSSTFVSISNTANMAGVKWKITFLGVDAPAIRQSQNYYCAAASTLQALFARNTYLSEGNSYNLSNWTTAQETIWAGLSKFDSTTPNDGAIRDYLKVWLGKTSYKMNYRSSFPNKASLLLSINGNLKSGYVPIVHASGDKIEKLPYCGQSYPYTSGHYITVIGYDSFTDQVIVSDCNWNANYYGIFAFSAQKLHDALADLTYYGYYQ